jgi:hypothetical protein
MQIRRYHVARLSVTPRRRLADGNGATSTMLREVVIVRSCLTKGGSWRAAERYNQWLMQFGGVIASAIKKQPWVSIGQPQLETLESEGYVVKRGTIR